MAFQSFGTDFAFQNAQMSFKNAELVLSNLDRYLNGHFKFEFSTFTQFHHKFHNHFDFDKILPGDMFVYDEKNNDSWSGYYGSKPDLKLQIKRIFNVYRATETLMFTVRVEFEQLKLTKITSDH